MDSGIRSVSGTEVPRREDQPLSLLFTHLFIHWTLSLYTGLLFTSGHPYITSLVSPVRFYPQSLTGQTRPLFFSSVGTHSESLLSRGSTFLSCRFSDPTLVRNLQVLCSFQVLPPWLAHSFRCRLFPSYLIWRFYLRRNWGSSMSIILNPWHFPKTYWCSGGLPGKVKMSL